MIFASHALLPVFEVEPGGQDMHCAEPNSALYVPATQRVQAPPLDPVKPALHLQSFTLSLPAGEVPPVGHVAVHPPVPLCLLYLPDGHMTQGPPPRLQEPALQNNELDNGVVVDGEPTSVVAKEPSIVVDDIGIDVVLPAAVPSELEVSDGGGGVVLDDGPTSVVAKEPSIVVDDTGIDVVLPAAVLSELEVSGGGVVLSS